jgi:nucleotide-binding universal stress UspA family protein
MLPSYGTVLCAMDLGPQSSAVLRHALALAQAFSGRIVVLHAMKPLDETTMNVLEAMVPQHQVEELETQGVVRAQARLRERLEAFVQQEIGTVGAAAEQVAGVDVVLGSPAAAIIETAIKEQADLVVMGSHGHSLLGRLLIGSVASQVMQQSPIPVLLVPLPRR